MVLMMKSRLPISGSRRVEFSDELISRCIKGERDALEDLAGRCLPQIWHSVYLTCGGNPETDDIVQNAIIDAFCGLPTYRGTGSFNAWLNRIAVRAVYRHLRKRAFRSIIPFSDKLDAFSDEAHRPADKRTEDRRLLDRVAKHMKAIKIKNRMALALSMVQGYSVVEIADALGCNVETAKKRLQRGRTDLALRLEKDPYCRSFFEEVGK